MARLSKDPAPGNWAGFTNEDFEKQQDQFHHMMVRSEEAYRKYGGSSVDLIYDYPQGDGHAYYVVVKDKPLTLAHIPYHDAWELPQPHIRGLTLRDIRQSAYRLICLAMSQGARKRAGRQSVFKKQRLPI